MKIEDETVGPLPPKDPWNDIDWEPMTVGAELKALKAINAQLLEAMAVIVENSSLPPAQELIGCKAVARAAIKKAKSGP